MPKYFWPKWLGAEGCSSEVRIFISGNAVTTIEAAAGVQNRFERIIAVSGTPWSFSTLTAYGVGKEENANKLRCFGRGDWVTNI